MSNNTSHTPKSQDENLRLSPYQQARECYACDHTETAIRYKVYANGTRHYFEQCLNCGRSVGSAIPHKDVVDIDNVPPWDNQLENAYQFLIDEMVNQLQLEKEQQFTDQRSARRDEYAEYLKSDVWASKRTRVLKRDQYLCQACLTRTATQVHHKKYPEIFGDEPLFDLESVCTTCHLALHEIETETER
jgi:hypothetical protein